jgi:predicted alpha/beta-hydrolase family hydrolase
VKVYEAKAPRATFILAHGAGAESKSEWIVSHAKMLAKRDVRVVTFDFPKVRSTMVPLEEAYVKIVRQTHERFPDEPLAIGGKSMGGRVASLIAAKYTLPISKLVFFGYPLHPPKKPEKRRDAHLPDVKQPMLFLHGTRDPFGTPREMRALCKKLGARLVLFEGQGHDLERAEDEAAAFVLSS